MAVHTSSCGGSSPLARLADARLADACGGSWRLVAARSGRLVAAHGASWLLDARGSRILVAARGGLRLLWLLVAACGALWRLVAAPQPAHTRAEAVTREITSLDGPINDRAIKGVIGNMSTDTCHARSSGCARSNAPTMAPRQRRRDLPSPATARLPRDVCVPICHAAHLGISLALTLQ